MWDVATGTCIHTFIGHTSVLWEISFSPDGTVLVTAGEDGTCRTWNTTTGELTSTLIGLGDGGWITHLQRNHYRASSADDDVSWWAMGLCRFQLGELDAYVPGMTRIGNLAGQHPGPSIQH
ncbi:hypothetical protein FRACA_4790001 [Frankia canadensis]|uniref:Uncharacterized protein n=2 Tax=Frankia canadensis TaxID=1836972 RepID=A0A2I2KXX6_9ACTN|nr:hypothetical protein FRACA_4790001 [Frankia canadensis]SOU57801.1 hypothetical protein FRACA_4790001 [Frankia canadensis]